MLDCVVGVENDDGDSDTESVTGGAVVVVVVVI